MAEPSRVPEPRRPGEGDGQAEPRDGVHAADVRLRRRGSAQARHRGDDGVGARVQPLARRGLGLRPARPPDHLRRRSSRWPTPKRPSRRSSSCLARGAKMVLVRPAPVPGVVKPRSLGDPLHDPVWARLAEAGVPVGFHLSDSGYLAIAALWGGKATFEGFGKKDPLDQILLDDRAIHDTMASMIVHQVFTRHPKLKVASIENGSYFVYRLDQAAEEGRQHRAVPLQGGPGRAAAEQRLDRAVLRGRREAARRRPSASTRSCSARTGRTARGSRIPMSFTADIPQFPEFSAEDTRKVMRDNALTCSASTVGSALGRLPDERMDHRRGPRRHRRRHPRPAR